MFFEYVEYTLFVVVHGVFFFFLFAITMQLFKYYFLTEADLNSTQEICNFLNNPQTDEKMKFSIIYIMKKVQPNMGKLCRNMRQV